MKLKSLKMPSGILSVILLVLFIFCIHGLLTKVNNGVFISMIVVPIALYAILPLQFGNMKKIKAEIESRNKL